MRVVPCVKICYPRQANAVFVHMPQEVYEALHKCGWDFYTDVGPDGAARLMCSWDTAEEDVNEFVKDVINLSKHP